VLRRLYTVSELQDLGVTRSALRTGAHRGRWRKVEDGVYAEGPDDPTPMDRARAAAIVSAGVASGMFAGALIGLDGVVFDGLHLTVPPTASGRRSGAHRRALPPDRIIAVAGIRCTDAIQTLIDLADALDDLGWEQALESALRRQLVRIGDVERAALGSSRGVARMRRVLTMRPDGARPTESLLETLMVQLMRTVPGLSPPDRQITVCNAHGEAVARVDLAWPGLGLFIELDGQHHQDQPVYDARRETAVVAATGWLCGRFTWKEVVRHRVVTARRVGALAAQARRRPLSA
jgi:hypothetical protein